ncbi:MAG: hypothetical protein KC636_20745, partial [Myxococcales bacterium]|nr:hypothetical protein [Myxococcales bacterium]
GVFYTPRALVSFVLRGADEALARIGAAGGLAGPLVHGATGAPVRLIEPAAGAGAFLVELLRHARAARARQLAAAGHDDAACEALARAHLRRALLPKIVGFELLAAPWAVAHLRIAAELARDGPLESGLTLDLRRADALAEPWPHEGCVVVVGNPPYAGKPARPSPRIHALLRAPIPAAPGYFEVDGAPLRERTSKWLADDYVAFLRQAQVAVAAAGVGLVAFVTNHGLLRNPTFRGLRRSLLETFDDVDIVDLRGEHGPRATGDAADENVFPVRRGVCVALLGRGGGALRAAASELRGRREDKLRTLARARPGELSPRPLAPRAPLYLLGPVDDDRLAELDAGLALDRLFTVSGVGLTTARDEFVIDRDPAPLLARVRAFRDHPDAAARACEALGIRRKRGWDPERARAALRRDCPDEQALQGRLQPILYRPFEPRLIFLHPALVWRTADRVMRHMLAGPNVALVSARTNKSELADHFFCARTMIEAKCGESTTQSRLFPLYRHDDGRRRPNLDPALLVRLCPARPVTADELLAFLYAQVHATAYRERFAGLFRSECPRLFRPRGPAVLAALAPLGAAMLELHLAANDPTPTTGGGAPLERAGVRHDGARIVLGDGRTIERVDASIWNHTIGGYRVCARALRGRGDGRVGAAELAALTRVVDAVRRTRALTAEIDAVIAARGGFSGAFQGWGDQSRGIS